MSRILTVRLRTMNMIRVYLLQKKAKSKSKRKTVRRPKWNNDDVDDMVDVVVNSDYYKRKLTPKPKPKQTPNTNVIVKFMSKYKRKCNKEQKT